MARVLNLSNPLSGHPDNDGSAFYLSGLSGIPGVGGASRRWPGLTKTGRTEGAALVATPTWVNGAAPGLQAVAFNGTTQGGSVNLDLSGTSKITVSFWLWQDAFDASDDLCMEFTANQNANAGGFYLDPNSSSFGGRFEVKCAGNVGLTAHFAKPSAAAWHHYIVLMDTTVASNSTIPAIYVDGVAQSLTYVGGGGGTIGAFANSTLNLMCRNSASLFNAGRMAGVVIVQRLVDAAGASRTYRGALNPQADPRFNWIETRRSVSAPAAESGNGLLLKRRRLLAC